MTQSPSQPPTPKPPTEEERRAAQRVGLLHLTRIFSLGFVIMGISIVNEVLPGPYALGVVIAIIGLLAFFFAPPVLIRRWKAGDGDAQ